MYEVVDFKPHCLKISALGFGLGCVALSVLKYLDIHEHTHVHEIPVNQVEILALPCFVLICMGDWNSAS